jgi:hypothetical protein
MIAARERVHGGREGSGVRGQKLFARCTAAKLPVYCHAILAYLAFHEDLYRDGDGTPELIAWPSQDLIAARTGLSRPTVIKGLRLLERAGLLRIRTMPGAMAVANAPREYVLVCTKKDTLVPFRTAQRRVARKAVAPTAGQPFTPVMVNAIDHQRGQPPHATMVNAIDHDGQRSGGAMVNGVDPKYSGGNTQKIPNSLSLEAPRVPHTTRTPEPKALPPVLTPLDVCATLHRAAPGRFPVVEPRDLAHGHAVAIACLVRDYPDPAEWEALGAWLAAGGLRYRNDLGASWLASAHGARAVMPAVRAWQAAGQPTDSWHDGQSRGKRALAPAAAAYRRGHRESPYETGDLARLRASQQRATTDLATIAMVRACRARLGREALIGVAP